MQVDALLHQVDPVDTEAPPPKALVVPHAGYVYSGPVAATAYARLRPLRGRIARVVLLGPCHRVPVRGLALPGAAAFLTPLGAVEVDAEAVREIRQLAQVVESAQAHALEHSIEVQLPFLQAVLGDFRLVPLAVGDASPEDVAEVLERLWGGPETLVVISSDLSHYLPQSAARRVDRQTVDRILGLDARIDHEQACGATPLKGLLAAARRKALSTELLDLRDSGDTAGDPGRVVGYASIAFFETATETPDSRADPGEVLLAIARAAIARPLGAPASAPEDAPFLRQHAATFVTLKKHGELRGCIGTLQAHRPLLDDVRHNAHAAAFLDPRFQPLTLRELAHVRVEVSLLEDPVPVPFEDESDLVSRLRPHVDGLILEYGRFRGTFLPQVWESLPRPHDFLRHLKRKAGLPEDFWAEEVRVSRYTVRKWAEGA
jgi:AmmeMemoRadiSam system protein B/AmmeMemoRadiSam system protein A